MTGMRDVIQWLLQGDISVQYMTHRLLLDADELLLTHLQERIATEGFGAAFLSRRNDQGHWGLYYYQPKWTSTHYTLLDLKSLCAPPALKPCREMVMRMFDECMLQDGGMNLSKYEHPSDTCVDGMVLHYASYFCPDEPRVIRLAGHLLAVQKADGGFSWDDGSHKGDPHTTICVLEGLGQFDGSVPNHGIPGIEAAKERAVGFLLENGLFMDSADQRFRKLSHPYRYRYDLLRVLECLADLRTARDPRIRPALDWLQAKRRKDGLWPLENQHKGNVHFAMEKTGDPSRFVTVKALYVSRHFRDNG